MQVLSEQTAPQKPSPPLQSHPNVKQHFNEKEQLIRLLKCPWLIKGQPLSELSEIMTFYLDLETMKTSFSKNINNYLKWRKFFETVPEICHDQGGGCFFCFFLMWPKLATFIHHLHQFIPIYGHRGLLFLGKSLLEQVANIHNLESLNDLTYMVLNCGRKLQ